jgi:hypothetical protein
MVKKVEKKKSEKKEEEGMSLDDAFGDDEDVEYAPSKPKKEKKKKEDELDEEIEEEVEEIEALENGVEQGEYKINASKPISKLKKNDRVNIDGIEYIIDDHIVLIDHGTTKEMALEIFNPKTDKDYQLRYFDDQVERTMELYELQEILYVKRVFKKVEW